jgi:hypothetical protein
MDDDVSHLERLARLEAAEDVRRLIVGYATACDAQDPEMLRPIFASDVVLTAPGLSLSGAEAVLSFYADVWASTPVARRHFITNTSINELTPDQAEATSYFLFVSSAESIPKVGWGTYRDTFARREGRLVFTSKHIVVEVDVDVRAGWANEFSRSLSQARDVGR